MLSLSVQSLIAASLGCSHEEYQLFCDVSTVLQAGKALAGSAGGSGAVVSAAVLAVVEESAVPADEAAAAVAVERPLPRLALLPRHRHCDAGTAQGIFDVHVPLVHQAPCFCLEVRQWPDHRFLWGIADRFGGLKSEVVCLLESEGVAYWPSGQGNVVSVPVTSNLQDNGTFRAQLIAGFVQADVLVVDAEMCAGIDVIFWPGNVCFPVATGLLLGEQLGLVQVGGVTAA